MRKTAATSRDAIVAGAIALLSESGGQAFTVEAVASRIGCAKGLVHYHFKTKEGLASAIADRIVTTRIGRWRQTIAESQPEVAIQSSWSLLTEESATGVIRAWATVLGDGTPVPDPKVRECVWGFAEALGHGTAGLLDRLGVRPRIPAAELGWLVTAVVLGMGTLLSRGVPQADLEGAYAAAWLGVLSLAADH